MAFPFKNLFSPSSSTKKKLYGTKPEYGTTESAAAEALRANLANLPEAEKLAGKVNTFNAGEMSRLLEMTQPGFAGRQKEIGNIYDARLKGEFSKSELDQLQLSSASRGVESGTFGSNFDEKRLARQLGLHQWEETQKTIDSFSRWTQSVAQLTQPATFNVGSAFVPYEAQQGWNDRQAELKAAPSPGTRGAFDTKMAALGMFTSGYAGGQGYNQAYRPSGGQPQTTDNLSNPNLYPQYGPPVRENFQSSPGYGSGGPYE